MIRKLFTSGLLIVGLLALVRVAAAQAPATGYGCPCPDACPEKVCHRVTENKTIAERKYDAVCEDFCYPRCGFFSLFTGGCGDCADGKCSCVRTKKYLLVKIRKHDECVSKCVVGYEAPACPAPCPAPCYPPTPVMPPPAPKVGALMPTTIQAQQWPR